MFFKTQPTCPIFNPLWLLKSPDLTQATSLCVRSGEHWAGGLEKIVTKYDRCKNIGYDMVIIGLFN